MLLIANHKPCQVDSTLHEHYEIGKFMVFMVYKFTDNLQRIVDTSHWPISELLHLCTVDSLFFNQLESYYTFARLLSQSVSSYTFLHCLHVQEKLVAT